MRIQLSHPRPEWASEFTSEAARLQSALTRFEAQIEHIGSTSVPGLVAKPILDILIGLPQADDLDMAAFALLPLGYLYIRHYERIMPERRYLIRVNAPPGTELPVIVDSAVNEVDRAGWPETHHVHMVTLGSDFWQRHLAFRDHLRSHPEDREAYAAHKRDLATREWESGNHYAAAKTAFIQEIEGSASA